MSNLKSELRKQGITYERLADLIRERIKVERITAKMVEEWAECEKQPHRLIKKAIKDILKVKTNYLFKRSDYNGNTREVFRV